MKSLSSPEVAAAMVRRLGEITPDSQRRWGRMTSHQMLCHLADTFAAGLGERRVTPADTAFRRTVVKWIALWVPIPWPHGVPTRKEIDAQREGTRPGDFAADRQRVEAWIDRYAATTDPAAFGLHPLFGPLTPREWTRWAYLHLEHHFRQFGV